MTKFFEDDLVLEEDKTFEESIKVKGNIRGKDGENFKLTVKGSIDAEYIDAEYIDSEYIDSEDIDAWDIDSHDIDAGNINAWDIDAGSIDAWNISFYGFCISRKSLKCVSIEGRRENSLYECLDQDVEFKEDSEDICECCGQKIEDKEVEE